MISSEVKNQHEGKLVSNQFIVLLLTLLLDDDSDTLTDLTNDVVVFLSPTLIFYITKMKKRE